VVVAADLLGFPKRMADHVTAALKNQCRLERSQIMLTCSHTHSGPVLRDALYDIYPLDARQRGLIEEYSNRLEKTVVATVAQALAQSAPATLWAGEGTTSFAVNRRNNREGSVAQLRAKNVPLRGPDDHDVPVLVARTPAGRLRAVVFGYACHCTTLDSYQWSGDYAGFAQLALEEGHPEMLAMFYAGCGADQNPLPRRRVEQCRRYGQLLAAAVEEVLLKPMRPISPRLQTVFKQIELDYQDVLDSETLKAVAEKDDYHGRRAKRLLKQLDAGGSLPESYSYPLQAWRLGDQQLWIALGGEVVVDYALRFKKEYGPQTWIAGYCNDVMAYIPSRRVWEEGGYESGAFYVYGLPTDRWAPDIEQRVSRGVATLVESLK
jgi:hypothetical protein